MNVVSKLLHKFIYYCRWVQSYIANNYILLCDRDNVTKCYVDTAAIEQPHYQSGWCSYLPCVLIWWIAYAYSNLVHCDLHSFHFCRVFSISITHTLNIKLISEFSSRKNHWLTRKKLLKMNSRAVVAASRALLVPRSSSINLGKSLYLFCNKNGDLVLGDFKILVLWIFRLK